MMHLITNGDSYLCIKDRKQCLTDNIDEATRWNTVIKANNVLANLKKEYKELNFSVKVDTPTDFDKFELDITKFASDIEVISHLLYDEDIIDKLQNDLREIEMYIVDIEHAIEFDSANACDGYKYYKLLHDVLCVRRKHKDEIKKLMALRSFISQSKANDFMNKITAVDTQKYTPRIAKELFDDERFKKFLFE